MGFKDLITNLTADSSSYEQYHDSGDGSSDSHEFTTPPPPRPDSSDDVEAAGAIEVELGNKNEIDTSGGAAACIPTTKKGYIAAGLMLLLVAIAIALGVSLGGGGNDDKSMGTSSSSSSSMGFGSAADDIDGPPAPGTRNPNTVAADTDKDAGEDDGEEVGPGDKDDASTVSDTSTSTPPVQDDTTPKNSKPGAPNVVFIVLDDLGYADVGFTQDQFGDSTERLSEVKTPNIDALAREGVIFTNAYSTGEVCAPTRAGYMLGRYQQGVGVYSAKSGGGDGMKILEYDSETGEYANTNPWIPQFLKQQIAGTEQDEYVSVDYATGAFGKWHLGVDDVFTADDDGIYRYKSSEDTLYSSLDEGAENHVVFPTNGPLVEEDGFTPITEGIPDLYSRIASVGRSGSPYHPLYRGFDANHIFMGRGSKDYYDPNEFYKSMDQNKPSLGMSFGMDPRKNPGNALYPDTDQEPTESWDIEADEYIIHRERNPSTYATNNFTNAAIDFIRNNAGSSQPFFAYLPYSAPHWPAQTPYHKDPATGKLDRMGEDMRRYGGMSREEFAQSGIELNWFEPDFDDNEWFPDPLYIYQTYKDDENGFANIYVEGGECCTDSDLRRRAITTAMNRWVDKGIGQIVAALKDPNGDGDTSDSVYEDTMIIFISDNGGAGKMRASNKPLKGGKFYVWEGGHRVPYFVAWDRYLSDVDGKGTDKRGTSSDAPITSLDILPTILDVNGINDPSKNPLLRSSPSDGKSLLPLLSGSTTKIHKYIYWATERSGDRYEGAVRRDEWKLILDRKDGPGLELFNLGEDITETRSLVDEYPDIVAELKEVFIEWMNEMAQRNGEEVPNSRLSRMTFR